MGTCRFCGLALGEDDDEDYHQDCVDAPVEAGGKRKPDPQHPIYGPTRVIMEQ